MDYLWLVISWLIYFILHSVLAIRQIKSYALARGISSQKYRLFYNLFALISLIPIGIISMNIPSSDYVIEPNSILKFSGLLMAVYGVILARKTFKVYDTKAFLGLGPIRKVAFKTDGLLKYVRHPLYSASMLIVIGYFLYNPKWDTMVNVSMVILYFFIGSYFEERKLIREFGDKYIQYKQSTPMFIPRFWKRS